MFFLVRGWGAENTEKKKKTDRRKTLKEGKKKEEYQESEHLWFYLLYKKSYFARKHNRITKSHFIYIVYALQDIWNPAIIHQSLTHINIQIII